MAFPLSSWLLGFVSGARHALEPDHVTAVTSLVAREKNYRITAYYACFWGLGHAVMLFGVGSLLFLFKMEMNPVLSGLFELAVAFMLCALGLRGLWSLSVLQSREHLAASQREQKNLKEQNKSTEKLPFLVGLMHGLAGSGGTTALLFAYGPNYSSALTFLFLYSLGSILGMSALGGLLGASFAKFFASEKSKRALLFGSSALSLTVGVWWAIQAIHTVTSLK